MDVKTVIGNIGQWTAAVLCLLGSVLILRRSGFGGSSYIVIGSLFFAIFTKIKYYRRGK